MILFKPEHVEPILTGRKTQTRRKWEKCRVRVGAVHQAKTQMFGGPFARIRITDLRRERLWNITEADAKAEGYESITAYEDAFGRIYGWWDGSIKVWVVEFRRISGKE